MLKKNVLPDGECEKCETSSNERRQAKLIDRYTKISFHKDGTCSNQPMHNLDEYPYMEGTLIQGAVIQLIASKQLVTRLEKEVAAIASEKDQLLSQVREAKNKIKSAEQRAEVAEADARQLRDEMAEQKMSLTAARIS
ncbi:hypothetical protein N431DRAFT_465976 [Stipitochalara longipes BDJ]|nr:hypothetical protein N431DRAFT_465976 [Stipitochalara longipes BDJ]